MSEKPKMSKKGIYIILGILALLLFCCCVSFIFTPKNSTDKVSETTNTTNTPQAPDKSKLGISYDNAMINLGQYFDMKKVPLNDGRERYTAMDPVTKTNYELIGDKANLSEASLIFYFPTDLNKADLDKFTDRTSEIYGRFLLNFFGNNSKEVSPWVSSFLGKSVENEVKIFGNKEVSVTHAPELQRMTIVSIKPAK